MALLESLVLIGVLAFIGILIYAKANKQSVKEAFKELLETIKDAFSEQKVVKK